MMAKAAAPAAPVQEESQKTDPVSTEPENQELPESGVDLSDKTIELEGDGTGVITITKQLVGSVWHAACDIMKDGARNTQTVEDPQTHKDVLWAGDAISNPGNVTGYDEDGKEIIEWNTKREGHRENHCGQEDNWAILVDSDGTPLSMWEFNAGSTGGTLKGTLCAGDDRDYAKEEELKKAQAEAQEGTQAEGQNENQTEGQNEDDYPKLNLKLTGEQIRNIINADDPYYTEFKANYENPGDLENITVEENKRLYWTTENNGQVWHHTGIVKVAAEVFRFVVKTVSGEQEFTLFAGQTAEIRNVEAGMVQIEEYKDSKFYDRVKVETDGEETLPTEKKKGSTTTWSFSFKMEDGEQKEITWTNYVKDAKDPEPEDEPEDEPEEEPGNEPEPQPQPEPQPKPEPQPQPQPEPEPQVIPEPVIEPVLEPVMQADDQVFAVNAVAVLENIDDYDTPLAGGNTSVNIGECFE
jgi:hypothetical protein